MSRTAQDARTAIAMDALRGALANIRVALQVLAETPAETPANRPQMPKMFNRGADAPTPAPEATHHEGGDR